MSIPAASTCTAEVKTQGRGLLAGIKFRGADNLLVHGQYVLVAGFSAV